MISLKRYLDLEDRPEKDSDEQPGGVPASSVLEVYRSTLGAMGDCGLDACPSLGPELVSGLERILDALGANSAENAIDASGVATSALLRDWGKRAARHYDEKAAEVRDLLLVIARTAEALGHKDERYLRQLDKLTLQLESIARLEDVTRMRSSIEDSARDLKASVARLSAESKAVTEHLRVEVSTYQTKLERAEHIASCDALTGLGTRHWTEARIQQRIDDGSNFHIVLIDIDDFENVNRTYGKLVGDLLLKEFARELRSSCRFTDVVGRWGSDEFIMAMDNAGPDAKAQISRLRGWISKSYHVPGKAGYVNVELNVSIGIAEYRTGDDLFELLGRADAELCREQSSRGEKRTA